MHYGWSNEFLEAGEKRLAYNTVRAPASDRAKTLHQEALSLKAAAVALTLENRLLQKA